MTRRAATRDVPEDDDSQKENAPGSSPPVSRVNKGKEPVRRVDDDEQTDRDGSGEEDAGSPKGRKRARMNEEGDSVQVKAEKVAYKAKPKVLLRDKDQYVPFHWHHD